MYHCLNATCLLWIGCGLSLKDSCARRLVLSVAMLKAGNFRGTALWQVVRLLVALLWERINVFPVGLQLVLTNMDSYKDQVIDPFYILDSFLFLCHVGI